MSGKSRYSVADLAAIRRLWEAGASSRDIVERLPELKLTRSGVVGLAHRKGWASNGHGKTYRSKTGSPAVGARDAAPKVERTCQFPFGDPRSEAFRFCGRKPVKPGSSYCEEHHARCYRKPGEPFDGPEGDA